MIGQKMYCKDESQHVSIGKITQITCKAFFRSCLNCLNKKKRLKIHSAVFSLSFLSIFQLCRVDSSNRAYISTSSTINTFVSVYAIDIAFRDSSNRAFVYASSACCTIITNFISHFFKCFRVNNQFAKIYILIGIDNDFVIYIFQHL